MSKRVKRVLLIVGAACVAAMSIVLVLIANNTLILFKHGIVIANASHVHLAIEADELVRLGEMRSLTDIDFTGSSCYADIEAWSSEHPNINVSYDVQLPSNIPVDSLAKTANLSSCGEDEVLALADRYLRYASNIDTVVIDANNWQPQSFETIHATCPHIHLTGTLSAGTTTVPLDASDLDLTSASPEDLETFSWVAWGMPHLKTLTLGKEDGHAKLSAASRIKQTCPNATVSYTFMAYGKEIDINDTALDFRGIRMDDNGEGARTLLAVMPHVTSLDMDSCGVDDEHMAAIRDDFPAVNVIWRVWFGTNYTVRTDVTKILASYPAGGGLLSPENDQSLKYCTKVKYLDLGHNDTLRDISFVSYMPDLEVFICILGNITDISPLANCPHLEFLEIFSNYVSDLSPLAGLTELRHLNASNNPGISDLSPLSGIHDMERFWCGPYNSIPYNQFAEFQETHPNCTVNFTCLDPHQDWRWGTERYALLQEQLGYPELDFQTPDNDPLYVEPSTDAVPF